MEAFSLLNYWKNNSGSGSFLPPQSSDSSCRHSGEATTIVTSVTETEEEEPGDDEGPFFDLKFAVPVEEEESEESNGDEVSDCTDGGTCEYKFTLSPCSGGEEGGNQDLVVSPSGEVYFKGQIMEEVEPPSTGTEQTCSVKAPAAQLSASILRSATKLRVFMLGAKKSKLLQAKPEANTPSQPPSHSPESQLKSTVTVDLKVEEVPMVSPLTRDNSSRNSSSSSSSPSTSTKKKQNGNEAVVLEENRFVMMQKYLKKVKPLYIRVSRRYGEKLKHSNQLSLDSSAPTATRHAAEKAESPVKKAHKPGNININIPAGFKVVKKHLGKSRSSSSTTTVPPPAEKVTTPSESRRRDDSLLQQQDSIQSAILHCKRSFNSSRDKDPSVLPRSVSDSSSYDK